MKEDRYQELIVDYLNGNLTAKEVEKLRKRLEEEGYDLSRLDQMDNLVSQMDDIGVPEPRQEMSNKFYRMLEEEKASISSKQGFADALLGPFRSLRLSAIGPGLAYAVILLLIGFSLGQWIVPGSQSTTQSELMMDEIQGLKKMMALTLFEQSNASDRLQAVSFTSQVSQPDAKMFEALLKTLNSDPSVNVRLASLDALISHVNKPEVRIGLIHSITHQDAPLVQIAIAELMIQIEEKDAVPEMEKLLQRNDLNDAVEVKLKESIQVLT